MPLCFPEQLSSNLNNTTVCDYVCDMGRSITESAIMSPSGRRGAGRRHGGKRDTEGKETKEMGRRGYLARQLYSQDH